MIMASYIEQERAEFYLINFHCLVNGTYSLPLKCVQFCYPLCLFCYFCLVIFLIIGICVVQLYIIVRVASLTLRQPFIMKNLFINAVHKAKYLARGMIIHTLASIYKNLNMQGNDEYNYLFLHDYFFIIMKSSSQWLWKNMWKYGGRVDESWISQQCSQYQSLSSWWTSGQEGISSFGLLITLWKGICGFNGTTVKYKTILKYCNQTYSNISNYPIC